MNFRALSFPILVVTAALLAACGDSPTDRILPSIGLTSRDSVLEQGDTMTLAALIVGPRSTGVVWSSSDTSVARVSSSGTVTGGQPGTATITASAASASGTVRVHVFHSPLGLRVIPASFVPGQTLQLQAIAIFPSGAEPAARVHWSSSDSTVLRVDSAGRARAIAPGTAEVTVATARMSGRLTLAVLARGYVLTQLSALSSSPADMNATGTVVGTMIVNDAPRPFSWTAGVLTELPTPNGAGGSAAVNEAGTVVGWVRPAQPDTPTVHRCPAQWSAGGAPTVLADPPLCGYGSAATAVTGAGTVIAGDGWIYANGQRQAVPAPAGVYWSYVSDGTSAGTLVGLATSSVQQRQGAALLRNGIFGWLGGARLASAVRINEAGVVAGADQSTAVLWFPDGESTTLLPERMMGLPEGIASVARDVNQQRSAVGDYSYYGGGGAPVTRAFLWNGAAVVDLSDVVAGGGWTVQTATAINDRGWIVGTALPATGGPAVAVLLKPAA